MVDTVLQFEGDRNYVYRILRSLKNRFGSTAELGIYEMQGSGLREVNNPSEVLISKNEERLKWNGHSSYRRRNATSFDRNPSLGQYCCNGTPQRSGTGSMPKD